MATFRKDTQFGRSKTISKLPVKKLDVSQYYQKSQSQAQTPQATITQGQPQHPVFDFLNNLAKGTVAIPVKAALSLGELPVYAQGKDLAPDNRDYNLPWLGKTRSYTQDILATQDEVINGQKPMSSMVGAIAKPIIDLGSFAVGGGAAGRALTGRQALMQSLKQGGGIAGLMQGADSLQQGRGIGESAWDAAKAIPMGMATAGVMHGVLTGAGKGYSRLKNGAEEIPKTQAPTTAEVSQPKSSFVPKINVLAPGSYVKAIDRNNFGRVLSIDENRGMARVAFKNKKGGNATVDLKIEQLRNKKGGSFSLGQSQSSEAPQVSRTAVQPQLESPQINQQAGTRPNLSQNVSVSDNSYTPSTSHPEINGNMPVSTQVRSALNGQEIKNRGFADSVHDSSAPQGVKDLVDGTYVVKSDAKLRADARKLIQENPQLAEELAMNPQSDVHVQIGNELIGHYGSTGNFQKASEIANGMAKSGTELGRAVHAFANYDKTTPEGALKFAQQKINEYNRNNIGSELKVSDDQIKNIFDKAHSVQEMPQGRDRNIASYQLMEEVNNLIPSTISDKAITVWKAGLLTSLRTTERNIVGNTIHGMAEVAKDIPATRFDKLMALKTGQRTKTFTLDGSWDGAKKGI